MDCDTPNWLTMEYIEAVLQNHYSENTIKVSSIEVNRPIAKGNNYACEIIQVKVHFINNGEPLNSSFIFKVLRANSSFIAELLDAEAGAKEAKIYNEVLPKLNKMLKMHNVNSITANSYYTDLKDVVILEDLKFLGYKMVDRVKQLDLAHAEITLKAIAVFHAASYVLHEQEPEFIEEIGRDYLFREAKKDSGIEKLVTNSNKILSEEIKNMPELSRFSKRLNEFSDRAWEAIVNTMRTKPNEFTVLIHGDCWATNMMFKYNANQEPESVKLIDLQLCSYTSPAIDLLYFLYGNVRNEILKSNWDKLINIYLEELNEKLKKFGSKCVLSREELNQQINDRLTYLMNVNITVLPWILADPVNCENVSLDDAVRDVEGNPIRVHYRTEPFISLIKERLIEMEKYGCF